MLATFSMIGTKFACHTCDNGDQVCLPQFHMVTRYAYHASKFQVSFLKRSWYTKSPSEFVAGIPGPKDG